MDNQNRVVQLAHELQAISAAGLLYSPQTFDIDRYHRIQEIAAELIALNSEEPYHLVKKIFEENDGYQTPKISTRAAIFNEKDEVLLVKDYDEKWVMPGGWCDYNQTILSNVKKEVLEEAGLTVKPYRLVGLFDHKKRNNHNSFFYCTHAFMLCEVIGGEFCKNNETTQSDFFSFDYLPELNEHKTSKEQIEICLQAFKADSWNPIID